MTGPKLPTAAPRLKPRNCKLTPYTLRKSVPTFKLASELIAYASPDSTFHVTKELMRKATRSILIGIYDFSAPYVKDLLVDAIGRGVKVTLMLDIDSKEEQAFFDELKAKGCDGVPAPSCASTRARYFPCCHEKVIVIDDEWAMIQSGNYSVNSIPDNETEDGKFVTGNRDMGIAVRSPEVARFFTSVVESDIKLELGAGQIRAVPAALTSQRVMVPQPSAPPHRFKSLSFTPEEPIEATAILSPENYVEEVSRFLASAKRSVWIEQQYIRPAQSAIGAMLSKINAGLDVRVILPYGRDGGKDLRETMTALSDGYGLARGTNVRALNPRHFTHCHNKLIVVDETTVLISSQNWTNTAVLQNREAGLLLRSPKLAQYYGEIFKADWDDAAVKAEPTVRPKEGPRLIEATLADYVEV